jgi:hypothetical protein
VEQTDAAPTPVVSAAWKAASSAVEALMAEWDKVRARRD